MPERTIVFLAGMHRSGTSALARVLNLLGARLPEPLAPPSLGNELGHWEPAEAVAMNDRALLAAGRDVNSLHPLSTAWIAGGGAETFTEEIRCWLERVAPEGEITVVKDPRISLLAPWWRAAAERLGAQPRFIVSWRDPWEVSRSLASRQLEHFPDEAWPTARVELLWLKHQLEAERASRGLRRSFAAYAALVGDWRLEVDRLKDQLDLPELRLTAKEEKATDAFLTPGAWRQRRPQVAEDESGAGLTGEVVHLLRARRMDPDGGASDFDDAAARLDDAIALTGDYLAALEERCGHGPASIGDARALVAALREAAERADVQATGARPAADRSIAEGAPTDLAERHAGLKAAHAGALRELRAVRAEALRDLGHVRAKVKALEARQDADAEAAVSEAADRATEALARAADAEAQCILERERAEQAEAAAEHARGEAAEARLAQQRLLTELEDHRGAYEALREELALLRRRAAATRRDIDETTTQLHRAREEGAAAQQGREAVERALQAAATEAAALRASFSWRVTRPMRSVTFRLRRLARR